MSHPANNPSLYPRKRPSNLTLPQLAAYIEANLIDKKPSGCWEYRRHRNGDGYGIIRFRKRMNGVHRIMYEAANGDIPGGFYVLHACDNPPCCNPEHLQVGSQKDNMEGRTTEGRGHIPSGELNGRAKLNRGQVRDIRRAYAAGGVRQVDLARQYKVWQGTISAIVRGRLW